MKRFEGKVAVVTGGTSGIGYATALELARQGARVFITGRQEERGVAAVAQALEAEVDLTFVQHDAASEEDTRALFDVVREGAGRLDALIVSHGTLGNPGPVLEQSTADFRAVIDVNTTGSFMAAKYGLPLMRDGGAIVFVSSTVGSGVHFPGMSGYAVSKAALEALAKALALEVAGQGVRVNVLTPGGVDTPMFRSTMGATPESAAHIASLHAFGRVGRPEELAAAAVFLASDDAGFVTGSVLTADGGMTIK